MVKSKKKRNNNREKLERKLKFKCSECGNNHILTIKGDKVCSECGLIINTSYPYTAGIKINVRYTIKPELIRNKHTVAYYKKSVTEYKHNIPDYKIVSINRKPKPILY
jgi:hypothetical protein